MGTALIGGWLLASWDLFLDPQMVGEGYWTWFDLGWTLPGIPEIPLQNFLGWLLASMVLMWLLGLLPRRTANDAVPTTLLTWVFASSVFANLVFFGRPGVALGAASAWVWWSCRTCGDCGASRNGSDAARHRPRRCRAPRPPGAIARAHGRQPAPAADRPRPTRRR